MQVYRGMDIGTAKPTSEEQRGIPHRLLSVVDPDEEFNAAIYRAMSADQKLRIAQDLYWAARALKSAGLRHQHPEWNEEQIEAETRRLFTDGGR